MGSARGVAEKFAQRPAGRRDPRPRIRLNSLRRWRRASSESIPRDHGSKQRSFARRSGTASGRRPQCSLASFLYADPPPEPPLLRRPLALWSLVGPTLSADLVVPTFCGPTRLCWPLAPSLFDPAAFCDYPTAPTLCAHPTPWRGMFVCPLRANMRLSLRRHPRLVCSRPPGRVVKCHRDLICVLRRGVGRLRRSRR